MHEVISLQFGQRSNYLATHFWNTQESYFTYAGEENSMVDHDIHFRSGIGVDGTETFTPRTVIYDLKGRFGSMRKINALYEMEEPDIAHGLWNNPPIIQRHASIEKCAYQQSLEQDLEPDSLKSESVRYWSDYNRVFFHPKSIVQLNEYAIGSTTMPFESWTEGEELFKSSDRENDLVERDLRPFIEEADHMQAIQVISSTDNAWGSFTSRYLEHVKDEYRKTAIIHWGLEEGIATMPREKRYTSLSNTAKSISEIVPETTLFIPLTLPSKVLPSNITLERKSNWHVSALLSMAMESMLLLSRMRQDSGYRETIDHLETLLNTNGHQNITKLRMSIGQSNAMGASHNDNSPGISGVSEFSRSRRLPLVNESRDQIDIQTEQNPEVFDLDFFPIEIGEQVSRRPIKKKHVFSQYEIYRKPLSPENHETTLEPNVGRRLNFGARPPVVSKKIVPLLFPLLNSFPQIFDQPGTPSSITVSTSLTVDGAIGSRLKALKYIVNKTSAVDEREALSNSIGDLAEAYEEGWDSGSDEDDD